MEATSLRKRRSPSRGKNGPPTGFAQILHLLDVAWPALAEDERFYGTRRQVSEAERFHRTNACDGAAVLSTQDRAVRGLPFCQEQKGKKKSTGCVRNDGVGWRRLLGTAQKITGVYFAS